MDLLKVHLSKSLIHDVLSPRKRGYLCGCVTTLILFFSVNSAYAATYYRDAPYPYSSDRSWLAYINSAYDSRYRAAPYPYRANRHRLSYVNSAYAPRYRGASYPYRANRHRLSYVNSTHATRYRGAPDPYISKQLSLPPFQSIHTYGAMDLQIDGAPYRQAVGISGKRKTLQSMRMYVKGKTLYMVALARGPRLSYPKIQISAHQLSQLNCKRGSGNIRIENISPDHDFGMDIDGDVNVNLSGNIRLHNLSVNGNSKVGIYWINSCDFSLTAKGKARVSLAGIATTLEITAFKNAQVDARYLRSKRAFVKAHGHSRVDLQTMCSLNAFASECGAIYYYQDPRFQAPFMRSGGSVVGMLNICPPPCDLCDSMCCKNGWH